MPQLALDGVRVLELTDGIAGPFCAKMLADYGAEVVKIEAAHPVQLDYPEINAAERTALHLHLNTNKKSVTLDLELERGRSLLFNLAIRCDVIVESMRPGTVEALGIGYERVSARRPDVVMTSVTPFGQTGPYRDWDYTELTVFAMTGAMHREGLPNRQPLKYGGEIAQYFGGAAAAASSMAAIVGAAMTGVGDWIDLSIFEAMAGHPHQIGRRAPFAFSGEEDPRAEPRTSDSGNSEQYAVGTFRCKDGYVSFLPLGSRMWPNIAQMVGRPELMDDPRFRKSDDRTQNRSELEQIFQAWLDSRTRSEVFVAAQDAGLPAGPVLEAHEVMGTTQFNERGYFREMDHPEFGTLVYSGLPIRLSDTRMSDAKPAPMRGQHSREILTQVLDLDEDEISRLVERGVVTDE